LSLALAPSPGGEGWGEENKIKVLFCNLSLLCHSKRKRIMKKKVFFLPLIPAFSPLGEKEPRAKVLFYRANSYRKD